MCLCAYVRQEGVSALRASMDVCTGRAVLRGRDIRVTRITKMLRVMGKQTPKRGQR